MTCSNYLVPLGLVTWHRYFTMMHDATNVWGDIWFLKFCRSFITYIVRSSFERIRLSICYFFYYCSKFYKTKWCNMKEYTSVTVFPAELCSLQKFVWEFPKWDPIWIAYLGEACHIYIHLGRFTSVNKCTIFPCLNLERVITCRNIFIPTADRYVLNTYISYIQTDNSYMQFFLKKKIYQAESYVLWTDISYR